MKRSTRLGRLTVGTRNSPLSRAQTQEVLSLLRVHHPDGDFAVAPIATGGDKKKDEPLLSLGRGTFVKEIEVALINGEIDFAVHSAKDLPTPLPDGLELAATAPRKDPRDVLVNRWGATLAGLPPGARIGTSSPRRAAQLLALRPDLRVLEIRGNVGTRVEKARGEDYDGVVLASAGLIRLGRHAEISEYLSPEAFTPEAGQGTLAVEARAGDEKVLEVISKMDHGPTSVALQAERAFLAVFGGGCKVPITAYARPEGRQLHILAMAAKPDGSRVFRTQVSADAADPESAGRRAADSLLEAGAAELI